jgi:hypothetical protein
MELPDDCGLRRHQVAKGGVRDKEIPSTWTACRHLCQVPCLGAGLLRAGKEGRWSCCAAVPPRSCSRGRHSAWKKKCTEPGGNMTKNQLWPGLRPPEGRTTLKRVNKQHEAARHAAVGPNEEPILSQHIETIEAAPPRYCDYYSFMSLADFMTWIQRDDGSEPGISYSRK